MSEKIFIENRYNIYCDESRMENPESRKMVIGALEVLRKDVPGIRKQLKEIFRKHDFKYELKWTKVHKGFLIFYKTLIDFFISNSAMSFRCIVVDKDKVNLKRYHDSDEELAFFKFYYLLLKEKLLSNNEYYIFLDKKPTRDKNRIRALHAFLDSYILLNRHSCNIKHIQALSSKENIFIQFADFFTGLVGFACNENDNTITPKISLIEYLKEQLGRQTLCETTYLSKRKFNVFVWEER